MLRKASLVLLATGALALGGCSSSNPTPDAGGPTVVCNTSVPPTCTIPAGATESDISSHIASAAAGTTFTFAAGTFKFTNTITVPAVAGLSFKGAGMGQTILEFAGQTAGSGGISATLGNTNIRFENFTIQNTLGDGIKVEKAIGVAFEKVQVLWSNAPDGGPNYPRHGGYGIYPVQCQNVLIDNCDISGARDTGAYIGQSFNIVVSNNTVHDNVAGIEIESSINADVVGNNSHDNTGGILVFALPTLQPPPGSGAATDGTLSVHVFNNQVVNNNTPNFADPSGTVAAVPGGTGLVVMASKNIEVSNNTISGNDTAALGVISYYLVDQTFDPLDAGANPTGLDPFPHNVYVHGNTFANNGTNPQTTNVYAPPGGTTQNLLGALLAFLASGQGGAFSTPLGSAAPVPDMAWDGIAAIPPYMFPTTPYDAGTPPNPQGIWVESNSDTGAGGAATWTNLNLPYVGSNPPIPIANGVNLIIGPFTTSGPPNATFPLPAIDAGILP